MKQIMHFNVNKIPYEIAVDPTKTLLEVIREDLGLTGTKRGCDEGDCGACTVLIDGKARSSCTTLAVEVQNCEIITIEGVKQGDLLHPVQQAFIDAFAIQCGFCTPGMIMSAIALLSENPDPTDEEIRDYMRGNICRCTGYDGILKAVHLAADNMKGEE